ncbi:hypothetical protein KCV03_g12, partial [Aureobasidium melanogenum]
MTVYLQVLDPLLSAGNNCAFEVSNTEGHYNPIADLNSTWGLSTKTLPVPTTADYICPPVMRCDSNNSAPRQVVVLAFSDLLYVSPREASGRQALAISNFIYEFAPSAAKTITFETDHNVKHHTGIVFGFLGVDNSCWIPGRSALWEPLMTHVRENNAGSCMCIYIALFFTSG